MISQQNSLRLSLDSVSSIDFRTTEITISDSKSGDTVTVAGFTKEQLERELSYYVRLRRWTHDKQGRDAARAFLNSLAENVNEGLKQIAADAAEAEEAAS